MITEDSQVDEGVQGDGPAFEGPLAMPRAYAPGGFDVISSMTREG